MSTTDGQLLASRVTSPLGLSRAAASGAYLGNRGAYQRYPSRGLFGARAINWRRVRRANIVNSQKGRFLILVRILGVKIGRDRRSRGGHLGIAA